MNLPGRKIEAVVMGGSAGGWEAVSLLLSKLPEDYPLPIAVVLHVHPDQGDDFTSSIARSCRITVRLPAEKDPILPGVVTFAPPDYHLLMEWDKVYALSADPKVSFSRPSIDVLFESAASVYGPALAGILLTGASRDGSAGILRIKELGGLTVVQAPETAEHPPCPAPPWKRLLRNSCFLSKTYPFSCNVWERMPGIWLELRTRTNCP